MLLKLVRQLLKKPVEPQGQAKINELLLKGNRLWESGDLRDAIAVYRECLELDHQNIEVLNNLGVCLSSLGDEAAAAKYFELIYTLDDTYLPGILNYARSLVDQRRSNDALPLIKQGFCREVNHPGLVLTLSSICLNHGDAAKALGYQLKSWLGEFDSLRSANAQLFKSTYADISEAKMASEHLFWAETCRPCELNTDVASASGSVVDEPANRRLRIGYWSPDLRGHSVRFFFRPLLEGHDRSRFEIFLYHDNHARDGQTDLIEKAADHFHDVYLLNDQDLYDLMKSHRLDILVEMAGHTSANRLPMLQHRLATVQLTGIGYPPTTGLNTVDGKLMDPYIVTPSASRYYAEAPVVLKNSFWCFDPLEDIPVIGDIPCDSKGHITFGCAGNLAKINPRMLKCWVEILEQVPDSRLVLRSISLEDVGALERFKQVLIGAKVPMERVDLFGPAVGADYYASYHELDIVLDTFPFNGGTTSCAATYMGVPVVSMYGESLVSRMGLSILSNLDAAHLAVPDEAAYVRAAVGLANDREYIRSFKRTARQKYKSTSLGNGHLFARSFEDACVEMLRQKQAGEWSYVHKIEPLPEAEILRRAYKVFERDNLPAARRIVAHCLKHYPDSGGVRVFEAQRIAVEKGVEAAYNYLLTASEGLSGEHLVAALFSLAHWASELGKAEDFVSHVRKLDQLDVTDACDLAQLGLFKALVDSSGNGGHSPLSLGAPAKAPVTVHVVVPCDDVKRYEAIRDGLFKAGSASLGVTLVVDRCRERDRVGAYQKALNRDETDVLILMQKTVDVVDGRFFDGIRQALREADAVGVVGGKKWDQPNWRADGYENKAAGFLTQSEPGGVYRVQVLGERSAPIVAGLAVLDGNVIAVNRLRVNRLELDFDDDLLGGEFLLEEDWVFRAHLAGIRLAVHRNLGVLIGSELKVDARDLVPARMRILEKHDLDPFGESQEDRLFANVSVKELSQALRLAERFFV